MCPVGAHTHIPNLSCSNSQQIGKAAPCQPKSKERLPCQHISSWHELWVSKIYQVPSCNTLSPTSQLSFLSSCWLLHVEDNLHRKWTSTQQTEHTSSLMVKFPSCGVLCTSCDEGCSSNLLYALKINISEVFKPRSNCSTTRHSSCRSTRMKKSYSDMISRTIWCTISTLWTR